jgi:hypothetical protein
LWCGVCNYLSLLGGGGGAGGLYFVVDSTLLKHPALLLEPDGASSMEAFCAADGEADDDLRWAVGENTWSEK